MDLSEEGLRAKIASVADERHPGRPGLLFHGTLEPFEDAPRAVGIDRILWFAESPLIAQTYIPCSGLSSIVHRPDPWRMTERVRPDLHSFWAEFVENTMGIARPDDVTFADGGLATSWNIPPDWPTYRQCFERLVGMGYTFEQGYEEIRVSTLDKPYPGEVMPAGWTAQGRVFVTTGEGLNIFDASTGEGDLQQPDHLKFAMFEAAREAGYDGIAIDDFAQSVDWGNVGHKAIGLFPTALGGRPWTSYQAMHRPMGGAVGNTTEDFAAFAALERDAEAAMSPGM